MRFATVLMVGFLAGCGPTVGVPPVGSRTDLGIVGDVYTVRHDGHDFVIVRGGGGIAALHHPGCRCGQVLQLEAVSR